MRRLPLLLAAALLLPAAAPDARSPAAARAVVERYYRLIDARDYGRAFALWTDGGRSLSAYRAGFARTAATRVHTGAPRDGDAGMGNVYVTVPVTVDARLTDGTRQRFRGRYVLGRINDVDGSTAEQRRWHLFRASLRAVPVG